MTKKTALNAILFAVSFSIGGAVFAYLLWQEGLSSILSFLQHFGWWSFGGFVVLSIINFSLYSWRWQLIINSHLPSEQKIPLRRVFFHRMAGYAFSYLTPAAQIGGEPVRIGMLMSDGVPGKKATSSVILDIALELIVYLSFIMAGVLLAVYEGVADDGQLGLMAIGLVFGLLIIFGFFLSIARGKYYFWRMFRFFRLHKIKRFQKTETLIKETEDLMTSFLQTDIWRLLLIFILAVVVIGYRVFEVIYIAYFFGVNLTFGQAFLAGTLPGIALIMPVPAGFGIFEGGFSAVFSFLSIPLSAIAFTLIIRLRDAFFVAVGLAHAIKQGGILFRTRRWLKK